MNALFHKLVMGCSAIAASFASVDLVRADIIAISDNSGTAAGLQNWPGNLGAQFTVNSAITVTQLGAFDNGLISNLSGVDGKSGVTVGIFNSSGVLVDSVVISPTSSGTQIGGDFFVAVTPFTLAPGNYTLVSFNDKNFNNQGGTPQATYTTSPLVNMNPRNSFVTFCTGTSFALPTTGGQFGPAPRYNFASFQFIAAPSERVD